MLRKAKQTDLPQILAMWRESFGDTDSGICSFFSAFPGCRSYVAELDGKAVSMVHALPQTLRLEQDCSAAYLYAVATAAPYRGRGLCRRLMAYAEADLRHGGFDCCVLTPGEPSLFGFMRIWATKRRLPASVHRGMGKASLFLRQNTAFCAVSCCLPGTWLMTRRRWSTRSGFTDCGFTARQTAAPLPVRTIRRRCFRMIAKGCPLP